MADQVAEATSAPPPARSGGRRVALLAGALVALAALGGGVWWLTHPTWFGDFGGEEGVVTTPGRPVWIGVTSFNSSEPDVTVHLDSVLAHVVSDTSGATVTSFVCTNRPRLAMLGSGTTAMMRQSCVHLERARDADMTVGRGHPEYLMLRTRPAHTGRLRIDRVDVTYRNGLQHGSQSIRFALTVEAKPHQP